MLLSGCSRKDFLLFLPRGGVVAEIGVARGLFSKEILAKTAPSRLHLIDPWDFQPREEYRKDPNNVCAAEQEERYRRLRNTYSEEIASGRIRTHRQYSHEAAKDFPDNYFDWIYVDAMHSYDAVTRDLDSYYDKVRDDGFILGHDYSNHPNALKMGFGVVEAVNDFCRRKGCVFLALTMEQFPTYVLAKKLHRGIDPVIEKLLQHCTTVVEQKDALNAKFELKIFLANDGAVRLLFSF